MAVRVVVTRVVMPVVVVTRVVMPVVVLVITARMPMTFVVVTTV
jgi:hypothetical protein